MKMNHWIEKDGKIIAVFLEEKMADDFLEMITGLKQKDFKDIRKYCNAVSKLGYEQYYGEKEIKG